MIQLLVLCVTAAFLFGASVGSFLNVVIYRVPRGMSVARPKRSFCPSCEATIPWQRNIPILSWILLNGRCGDCGKAIAPRYLVVELLTATLFAVMTAVRLNEVSEPGAADWILLLTDLLLASLIVAIAAIDLRHAIIPDPLTVPFMPLLVGIVFFVPDVLRGRMLDATSGGEVTVVAALLAGAALGALPALLVDFLRREREQVLPGEEPESALPTEDEEFSLRAEFRELFLPLLLPVLVAGPLVLLLCRQFDLASRPAAAAALASAAGVGTGLLFIYVIRLLFSALFGREAMGLGDAKFLGLVGAVLGAEGVLATFLLGCGLGSLPALVGLLGRMPLATIGLLAAAFLPLLGMDLLVNQLSPAIALGILIPLPVIALLLFLRHLRRSEVSLHAMPFGPFLALAALVLLLFWDEFGRFLEPFVSHLSGR